MKSEYSFIEYSYNPSVTPKYDAESNLSDLGFTKRANNRVDTTSMWTQKLCIVVLRETDSITEPAVTGIGIAADLDTILGCGACFDSETGSYLKVISGGLRILFINKEDLLDYPLAAQEIKLSKDDYRSTGLQYFSGLVLHSSDRMLMDFFQNIGFKFTKSGNTYNTLMCSNNRFSIMVDKTKTGSKISALIADTNDVFNTTASFVANGLPLRKFDKPESLNFGSLNYKIVGYNCTAFGNNDSYTIENIVDRRFANVDIIFRQRKQHLNVSETTLEHYYCDTTNT
jgi:hypothetical protein